eukprot:TRINITY_DN4818_c0_g3_i7.p1 TRINITY_DN4818_c0_g3~~TRINITY_DN4818_c0_g3_i7.p1  ORF type:complete len:1214 (+),score=201.75 TRINITY_DN4818_c0_g3_i7:108-3644(+)
MSGVPAGAAVTAAVAALEQQQRSVPSSSCSEEKYAAADSPLLRSQGGFGDSGTDHSPLGPGEVSVTRDISGRMSPRPSSPAGRRGQDARRVTLPMPFPDGESPPLGVRPAPPSATGARVGPRQGHCSPRRADLSHTPRSQLMAAFPPQAASCTQSSGGEEFARSVLDRVDEMEKSLGNRIDKLVNAVACIVERDLAMLPPRNRHSGSATSPTPQPFMEASDTRAKSGDNGLGLASMLLTSHNTTEQNRASSDGKSAQHTDDVDQPFEAECPRTSKLLELFSAIADGQGKVPISELQPLIPVDLADEDVSRRLVDAGAAEDGTIGQTGMLQFFDQLLADMPHVAEALDARIQLLRVMRRASSVLPHQEPRPGSGIRYFLEQRSGGKGLFFPDERWRWWLHVALLCVVLGDTLDVLTSAVSSGWYALGESPPRGLAVVWTVVSALLFGAETALGMCTLRRQGWQLIDDVRQVRRAYLRGWFTVDALLSLPFDCVFAAVGMGWAFRVVRFPKLVRLLRVHSLLFPLASPVAQRPKVVVMLLFIFWFSVCLGTMAVLWIAVTGWTHPSGEDTGITAAVYFCLTTITTVGYGDITPKTPGERWFVMAIQLAGLFFMSYMGAHSTAFLMETTPQAEIMKDRRRRFAALFLQYDIPWELQAQCFAILPSVVECSDSFTALMSGLPPWMCKQIESFAKVRALQRVPLFAGADLETLLEVAGALRTDVHSPGEEIVRRDEAGTDMYIIMNGCVEVTAAVSDGDGERWVATLKDGSWFGEQALLFDTRRTVTVRTITGCTIWALDRASFLSVAERCPALGAALQEDLTRRDFFRDNMRSPLVMSPSASNTEPGDILAFSMVQSMRHDASGPPLRGRRISAASQASARSQQASALPASQGSAHMRDLICSVRARGGCGLSIDALAGPGYAAPESCRGERPPVFQPFSAFNPLLGGIASPRGRREPLSPMRPIGVLPVGRPAGTPTTQTSEDCWTPKPAATKGQGRLPSMGRLSTSSAASTPVLNKLGQFASFQSKQAFIRFPDGSDNRAQNSSLTATTSRPQTAASSYANESASPVRHQSWRALGSVVAAGAAAGSGEDGSAPAVQTSITQTSGVSSCGRGGPVQQPPRSSEVAVSQDPSPPAWKIPESASVAQLVLDGGNAAAASHEVRREASTPREPTGSPVPPAGR